MRIVIPGEPIAKNRPKFSTRHGYMRTYDTQDKIKGPMKASLRMFVNLDLPNDFEAYFRLPISLSLEFHMPIPDSDSNSSRNAKLWGLGTQRPIHKPDIDNLCKWVMDLANEILWHDDAQIVELKASQIYSNSPCTIIEVTPIKDINMSNQHEVFLKVFSPDDLHDLLDDISSLHIRTTSVNVPYRVDFHPNEVVDFATEIIKFSTKWCDKLKKVRAK